MIAAFVSAFVPQPHVSLLNSTCLCVSAVKRFPMYVGLARLPYFPASFFAISSTIFGRRSAITLSTMRAIVLASVANADADDEPSAAAAAAAMAFGASSAACSACFAASTTSLFAAALVGAVRI